MMSPYKLSVLKGFVSVYNWNQRRKGSLEIPQFNERGTDRFPIPPVDLEDYTKVCRFSGSECGIRNYHSFTSRVDPGMYFNPIYRLLYTKFDESVLQACVFDLTICLRNETREEQPCASRVLGTVRFCHAMPDVIALPCPVRTAAIMKSSESVMRGILLQNDLSNASESVARCSPIRPPPVEFQTPDLNEAGSADQAPEPSPLSFDGTSPDVTGSSTNLHTIEEVSADHAPEPSPLSFDGTSPDITGSSTNLHTIEEVADEEEIANHIQSPPVLRKIAPDPSRKSTFNEDSFTTANSTFERSSLSEGGGAGSHAFHESSSKVSTLSDADSVRSSNKQGLGRRSKSRFSFEASPAFKAIQERKMGQRRKGGITSLPPTVGSKTKAALRKTQSVAPFSDLAQCSTPLRCESARPLHPNRSVSDIDKTKSQGDSGKETASRGSATLQESALALGSTPMRSNTTNSRQGTSSVITESVRQVIWPLFASQRGDGVPTTREGQSTSNTHSTVMIESRGGSEVEGSQKRFNGTTEFPRDESFITNAEGRAALTSSWPARKLDGDASSALLSAQGIAGSNISASRAVDYIRQQERDQTSITNAEFQAAQTTSRHNPATQPWRQAPFELYQHTYNSTDAEQQAMQRSSWIQAQGQSGALSVSSRALGALQKDVGIVTTGQNEFAGHTMSRVQRELEAMVEILRYLVSFFFCFSPNKSWT
jgi:hypothetical protein